MKNKVVDVLQIKAYNISISREKQTHRTLGKHIVHRFTREEVRNMTTVVNTPVVLERMIDQLSECELEGRDRLTPEDVISLVHNVCIDGQCAVGSLPSLLVSVYTDAVNRRGKSAYQHVDFFIKDLIHDMERVLV